MLSAFRRKPAAAAPTVEPPGPPPAPAASGTRDHGDLVDALEADLLRAIRAVSGAIEATSAEVGSTRTDLDHIRTHMTDLAEAGQGAARHTTGLASSTEELAATSSEITSAMTLADGRVGEAVLSAREANTLIAELSRATEEIVGIIDTISSVARQTNLLALNATIEAARAGAAGRGFAIVANEVKSLSVETGNAANDIRTRIERLRESAGSSALAVERVVAVIQDVQPVFTTVRTAVDEQNLSLGELAQRATEASTFVARVSERAQEVDRAAQDAGLRVAQAGEAAKSADGLAKALGQRFTAVLRQNEIGDRRRHDRFPTEVPVTIRTGAAEARSHTIDVSQGGLLVARPEGLAVHAGARIRLVLDGIGAVEADVAALSPMGIHCRFVGSDAEIGARIDGLVLSVAEEYRPLINVAQDAARRIELALQQALAEGRIGRDALFDASYRPLPGTDPQQFETAFTALFEDLMPPIQEPLLISDNRMIFCIAVDRNGYIPAHNRRYAQPQRRDDPVWNVANCRTKRIFDDRAGIAAARSTRPFLVQAYRRDMGGGTLVMLREIDAPIRVAGRHWGAFRTTYRL